MAKDPKQVDGDSAPALADAKNKWVRWTIAYLCILLVIVVALLVTTALFDPFNALKSAWGWYFRLGPNPSMTERKDLVLGVASIVQALAISIAGLVALAGLYFTRQTLLHNQETLRTNQENTQQTLALTEQGQLTERFTRAIDQLGATDAKGELKLETRLGGIYALERIDKESPERSYHPTVMEVLTAYIRENSRRNPEEFSAPTSATKENADRDEDVEQDVEPAVRRPPTDIQAILDVLFRRTEEQVPEQHRVLIDLREASLEGASLEGASLEGANLQEANLQEANLQGANLQRAILSKANLERAILPKAKLSGANLQETWLFRAYLSRADLQEANLQGANLQRAILQGADLRKARLNGANLQRAILQQADLSGVSIYGADLSALSEADLQKVLLSIRPASLREAWLPLANLQGADLQGAADLTQAQIETTLGDKDTMLPQGLHQPAAWSKDLEEQMAILSKQSVEFPYGLYYGSE